MTTLLLARHGETEWNRALRFQGHADPPLNDAGREQARALAKELEGRGVEAVYTSPLLRASETAEIVTDRLGVPVEPLVEERFPDGFACWLECGPGWDDGESYEELVIRVSAALHSLGARHPGKVVVAITHGGAMRAAEPAALGITVEEARRRRPSTLPTVESPFPRRGRPTPPTRCGSHGERETQRLTGGCVRRSRSACQA